LLLVGMAMVMEKSGMTHQLARWLAEAVGGLYPIVAPFIGALGAFMTGTNTHSNVVFGALQLDTARRLGLDELVILGAQNVGGAVGSVFAPAKVVVACAAAGIAAREHEAVRRNLAYGVIVVALTGLLTAALVYASAGP
jgi:lactate permease